ncbi:acyl carrier protein [Streptomyces sp. 7N604]|uniref:acyl carrier protein n=1 Tax=Streptomyces sp. 7N604 TaxID=3457415 RepID=UPI003FD4A73B
MSTDITVDKDQLRNLVADTLDVTPEAITDEARFKEDLQADSLIALELAVTLERRYTVEISEEEIGRVRRLPDVYELLVRKLQGRG